eukprot:TRINITY_DN1432_c0_g1_i12.p2 TRINITY_DN1432_c0_g1~~TRINITY_DN1432_c0_g1_i12.p2  ORF type:complete len:213 (+),score=-31.99 TRINITY_DN1432_c0_g1_i12:2643-3281(+)
MKLNQVYSEFQYPKFLIPTHGIFRVYQYHLSQIYQIPYIIYNCKNKTLQNVYYISKNIYFKQEIFITLRKYQSKLNVPKFTINFVTTKVMNNIFQRLNSRNLLSQKCKKLTRVINQYFQFSKISNLNNKHNLHTRQIFLILNNQVFNYPFRQTDLINLTHITNGYLYFQYIFQKFEFKFKFMYYTYRQNQQTLHTQLTIFLTSHTFFKQIQY